VVPDAVYTVGHGSVSPPPAGRTRHYPGLTDTLEEEQAMRERQSPVLGVVLRVTLISLLGLSVVQAQTTLPTAMAVTFPAREGNVQLTGQLYQPAGEGPFPAVVFLHGCAGIDPVQHHWAHRLQQWGYVVLLVDSFGPRGVTNVCTGGVALSPVDP
jgi:dipeptidyl aminopeptidase/acylaminoacyl peptidase